MLPWTTYEAMYDAARNQPKQFWLKAAQRITWKQAPVTACRTRADGWHDWFPDATLNTCHNAVDRHVADGRGGQAALIWHSCATKERQVISYRELQGRVAGFAGGLRSLGVEKGDRVLIAMPTMIETAIAMLACARIGAVHVVVFAGYAGPELARRINDVAPKIIIIASCSFQGQTPIPSAPPLHEALARATHRPRACVIVQRAACPASPVPVRDHDFHALEQSAPAGPVMLRAEDPLYILHTSGTTGKAKGIVRDNGGHAVALALSMELIYGCKPGDTFFTTSDLGWVVGHSYGVYAPLISGCTSVIVEGGASASAIRALCHEHDVKCLFTTPTQMRLMRQESRHLSGAILPALARIFVAGEYADPTLLDWARSYFHKPVVNHWWQTETGWSITAHFFGLPEREPVALMNDVGRPAPGFCPEIVPSMPGEQCGEIVLSLPLPPGCLAGMWKEGAIHVPTAYLDETGQYYRTFDEGMIEANHAVHMLGRSDDVIKVAGRRISGVQIEKIIATHPSVHACAVVAVPDALRGQRPVAYVVPDPTVERTLSAGEIIARVSEVLGRWIGLKEVRFVACLPTTVSGKITRQRLLVS
ncbi:AMP-binding protein [Komagataeibacter rhaeticus]|uniref:Propionyl-CoA synthetase n=1 Tax=Komagataeibacter rhaeticus TaxID=215221 RepID=A0A181CEJ7_9PROT|nr:AMP-binding protein [Komagataeibacter rhaeticus]ATU72733.1 acetyl-CoA synthetase [Komagataeibacter xylinus]QIP36561.1 propionyl-CoA synthetase [Komagataeibacter rhaeticus]QOC46333.1 AMP-binding protein [Komagataeibacter rhaeticus]WPP22504.1 AMP-binding protein [Komagataeibacter rhaeticus]SAY46854.1 Acetyl-coenzyme A synthetase [Komagataeibacter rhaeticus]